MAARGGECCDGGAGCSRAAAFVVGVERFMVRAGVRCFCKGQLLRRGLFIKVGTDYKMLKWAQGIVELYACDAIAGNWLCCAAASCQTPGKLRCEKKSDTRFC